MLFHTTNLKSPTKKLTPNQALLKAAHYCAYQERCQKEMREKLSEWGVWGTDAEEIILQLIEQNYLNEERFARAFAGGKFRIKNWGRVKIKLELKQREISEYCIRKAFEEIDEEIYLQVLKEEVEKKLSSLKDKNILVKKNKTAKYLIGRGFEADLVWETLRNFEC